MKAGDSDEFRLDGNAAAGILSEVFVPDLTAARATCAGCGAVRPVGALHVYAHEMGAVMRCPDCDLASSCALREPARSCGSTRREPGSS